MRKHFWEQTKRIETEVIEELTYSCPVCKEVVLRVPCQTIPKEKVTTTCSNGHKFKVPKFEELYEK